MITSRVVARQLSSTFAQASALPSSIFRNVNAIITARPHFCSKHMTTKQVYGTSNRARASNEFAIRIIIILWYACSGMAIRRLMVLGCDVWRPSICRSYAKKGTKPAKWLIHSRHLWHTPPQARSILSEDESSLIDLDKLADKMSSALKALEWEYTNTVINRITPGEACVHPPPYLSATTVLHTCSHAG